MKYITSTIKIIVLITLILTSVYQTSRLWFDDQSDHNFFYSAFSNSIGINNDQLSDPGNLIIPEQLGVYIGHPDLEYTVIKNNIPSYNTIIKEITKIITVGLKDGSYKGAIEDSRELWNQQHVLLNPQFFYDIKTFGINLNIPKNSFKDIATVGSIIVAPADSNETVLSIYVEDSESGIFYLYELPKELVDISNSLLTYQIEELSNEITPLSAYISTLKNNIPFYNHVTLLPIPSKGHTYHDQVFYKTPYIENGQILTSPLESYVGQFFDNPDIMTAITLQNEVRYVDGNVVVKYRADGLLEYNLISREEAKKTNISAALATANQFIESDQQSIGSEYVLRDYFIEDNQITFYYATAFNAYPFVMDQSVEALYSGMKYPIEVTVNGLNVIKYRRILAVVDALNSPNMIYETRYEDVLDKIIDEYSDKEFKIDDMYLGYKWTGTEPYMGLYWVVVYNGINHFYTLE